MEMVQWLSLLSFTQLYNSSLRHGRIQIVSRYSSESSSFDLKFLFFGGMASSSMDYAEKEDGHFSFPVATTRNSPPHFIDSTPLWWHPIPPTFPHKNPETSKGKQVAISSQDCKATRTYEQRKLSSSYIDIDDDEKMDLLWEDLNEELNSGNTAKISVAKSPGREVKVICVDALKLSKTRQGMLSERRLSILMLFKFFKKVFATHYSRNSVKKPHNI